MRNFILLLFAVLLVSCNEDSTSPSNDSIIGAWYKEFDDVFETVGNSTEETVVFIINFNSDEEYYVYTQEGNNIELQLTGEYSVQNNRITMMDENCDDVEGVYNLEFSGDEVEFILVDDECDRSESMTGRFKAYNNSLPVP